MKNFLIILIISIAITFIVGIFLVAEKGPEGEFCIGVSVAALFFIWIPIFVFYRSKNRSFKDYMLTKESVEAMRKEADNRKL